MGSQEVRMPIYVYSCEICGLQFEQIRAFSDMTTPACPGGHTSVRRVFSPPAIHFKGSGWYITDNRKKSNGKSEEKAEPGSDHKAAETATRDD